MTGYGKTRETLGRHRLMPQKKLGQNFLVNRHTAERIVDLADLTTEDTVIEVGVGLGALTRPLAERVKKVIGLEIDRGIIRCHKEEQDLPPNVELLHLDVLKCDFNQLRQKCRVNRLKIMANLPYSISNPFIFKLVDNKHLIEFAIIMLQKEVVDRLLAKPGSKDYGIPTVLLGSCAATEGLLTLKPAEFHPRPKIDSVAAKIDFTRSALLLEPPLEQVFNKIVRTALHQRRKTLLNNLSSGLNPYFELNKIPKKDRKNITAKLIDKAKIEPSVRAETLSIKNFYALTREFMELF